MRIAAKWLSTFLIAWAGLAGCGPPGPAPPPHCPTLCTDACDPVSCEARCDAAVSMPPSACREARLDQAICVAWLDCPLYADWEAGQEPYPCQLWDEPVQTLCPADETVFFISDFEGPRQLYAAPVDGSSPPARISKPLVAGGEVERLTPSPDRWRVAYWGTVEDTGAMELFNVPRYGGTSTKLNQPLHDGPGVFQTLPTAEFRGWSPDGSRVAYGADELPDAFQRTDLHTVAPDGSGRATPTSSLSCVFPGSFYTCLAALAWSPDGTRLVYEFGTPWTLHVDAAGGGARVQISPIAFDEPYDSRPRWSPDGSRVAFRSRYNGELYVSVLDGTPPLCLNCPVPSGPSGVFDEYWWNLDGARVLWGNDWSGPRFKPFYSSAADGTETIELTARGDRWSRTNLLTGPVYDLVAYAADPQSTGTGGLYVSTLDGGIQVQVSDPFVPGGGVFDFSWSPSGDRLAYRADQDVDDVRELYSAGIDGSGAVKINGPLVAGGSVGLIPGPTRVYQWNPDGTRIAYLADEETDEKTELYGNSAAGGSHVKLSVPLPAGESVDIFVWSPEGTRILYRTTDDVLYSVAPDGTDPVVIGTGVSYVESSPYR